MPIGDSVRRASNAAEGHARAARPWVERGARLGYAARGALYLLLGGLALKVAARRPGGELTDNRGAVRFIGDGPWGDVLLVALAVGLFGYTLWRLIGAVMDPEHTDRGPKAAARRLGYGVSALLHGALGVAALQRALGGSAARDGARTWIGQLLASPAGRIVVAVAGFVLLVFAVVQIVRAVRGGFLKRFDLSGPSAPPRGWTVAVARAGIAARGVVFGLLAWSLGKAAWEARSEEARDVGGVLRDIAAGPAGPVLLTVVALGLVAYGVYQLIAAGHRRIRV